MPRCPMPPQLKQRAKAGLGAFGAWLGLGVGLGLGLG